MTGLQPASPDPFISAATGIIADYPTEATPDTGWPCCELVATLLERASGSMQSREWHKAVNIWDIAFPFSVVPAVAGLVEDVPWNGIGPGFVQSVERNGRWDITDVEDIIRRMPIGWSVVQGWHGPTGHQWMLRHDGDGMGIRLESNTTLAVRLGGMPWRRGLPPKAVPEDQRGHLLEFWSGVGVAPLWEPPVKKLHQN